MSQHLQHDCAWACASALAELVDPLLNEEQQQAFFAGAYKACLAMIESHEILKNREGARLCRPTPN